MELHIGITLLRPDVDMDAMTSRGRNTPMTSHIITLSLVSINHQGIKDKSVHRTLDFN